MTTLIARLYEILCNAIRETREFSGESSQRSSPNSQDLSGLKCVIASDEIKRRGCIS